jgi:hypothetical protein
LENGRDALGQDDEIDAAGARKVGADGIGDFRGVIGKGDRLVCRVDGGIRAGDGDDVGDAPLRGIIVGNGGRNGAAGVVDEQHFARAVAGGGNRRRQQKNRQHENDPE